MFNDSLQLPVKFLAFSLSGSNSATFYAELVRSGIDATNHIILLATNFINFEVSKKYPYGTEKIKNIVVMIPALLFFAFGIETIYNSFYDLLIQSEHIKSSGQEVYSILLYLASLAIEISVISYNMADIYKMQLRKDERNKKIRIRDVITSLFKKKDPLLQAILYENAITLTSVSIPLICSSLHMFYQTAVWQFIGANIIGAIQLYLGVRLGAENIQKLLGEAIDEDAMNNIVKIIKSNKYVIDVKNEKAVMLGPLKFRFFAYISYNIKLLNEMIMTEYGRNLQGIIYSGKYEDREEELNELLISLPTRLFKEIEVQRRKIEKEIGELYPECIHIDLEMENSQLLNMFYDQETYGNHLFQDFWKKEKIAIKRDKNELEIFNQNLIDKFVEQYLSEDSGYLQKQKIDKYKSILNSPEHLDCEEFTSYLSEYNILHDKFRRNIVQEAIEDQNYWYDFENPYNTIIGGE